MNRFPATTLSWRACVRSARYVWAAPNTAVGLLFGLLAVLCGAHLRIRQGALEVGGGWLCKLPSRLPARCSFSALTLGHVILGINGATLDSLRVHEQVHVRQYERWGPLFLPAYFLSSLLQLLLGRRPYLDNHFEREAYAESAAVSAQAQRQRRDGPMQ